MCSCVVTESDARRTPHWGLAAVRDPSLTAHRRGDNRAAARTKHLAQRSERTASRRRPPRSERLRRMRVWTVPVTVSSPHRDCMR